MFNSVAAAQGCIQVSDLNSLRPSDAYMRQWINQHWFRQWLVAWPAPSHYLNQCWDIVNWTLRNKLQWNFNRNQFIFIQENALETIVCETASIPSRPQWVKGEIPLNISKKGRCVHWKGVIQYKCHVRLCQIWKDLPPFFPKFGGQVVNMGGTPIGHIRNNPVARCILCS